jgi:PAS domain S-box-containing protein
MGAGGKNSWSLSAVAKLNPHHQPAPSEALFQSLFEIASVGMVVVNPHNGRVLYVNDSYCRLTGFSRAELLTQPIFEQTHPEDQQADAELYQRVVRGEVPNYQTEKRYLRKDGSVIWVRVNATMTRNDAGEAIYSLGVVEDITEQKLTKEKLCVYALQSQELSHQLMETQENERRAIARELHDEIGQILTAVKINVGACQEMKLTKAAQRRLGDCASVVDQAIDQVRARVLDLRPPVLDDLGLPAALAWFCDQQSRRSGIIIDFDDGLSAPRLDSGIETLLYRVAQE